MRLAATTCSCCSVNANSSLRKRRRHLRGRSAPLGRGTRTFAAAGEGALTNFQFLKLTDRSARRRNASGHYWRSVPVAPVVGLAAAFGAPLGRDQEDKRD